ncbi:hypothetical protein GGR01_003628 [Acetobacter oeni]|nr:hypothetical protein [Acetobacter oeni]
MVFRRPGCSSAPLSARPDSARHPQSSRASALPATSAGRERLGIAAPGAPEWRWRPWSSSGRKVRGERNAAKGDRSMEGMPDTGRGRPSRKGLRPKKILDLRCTAGIDRATLLNRKSREGIERMQDRCVMLRAVNPERNVNRSWVCRIERDLFGACVVSVTFGRAGTHGRTIRRMVSGVTTRKCTLRTLRVNPTRTLRLFC